MKVQFEALVNLVSNETSTVMPGTNNYLHFCSRIIWQKGDVVIVEIVSFEEIYVTRNGSTSDKKRVWGLNKVFITTLFGTSINITTDYEPTSIAGHPVRVDEAVFHTLRTWIDDGYISKLQVLG